MRKKRDNQVLRAEGAFIKGGRFAAAINKIKGQDRKYIKGGVR